jgi:hypothetical protein
MNRHFASTIATTTAAIACFAAIASSKAYAETPTIDTTPFVSTRTRADVQAEPMSQRGLVTAAASEWAMQYNHVPQPNSGYTSEQAKGEYKAARDQVSAMTSEDSGSSYIARQAARSNGGTVMAGSSR